MRAAIEALIRGLPLDERARRILDETLLDWTIEADASSWVGGRVTVGVRSVVSIVRVLTVVSVRGATALPIAWLAGRMVLFGLLPCLAFAIAIEARLPGVVAQLPAWQRARYELYLSMAMLTATLPLALFYAVAWRPATRTFPVLGMASASAWLVVVYRAGILPVHLVDGRIPASLVQRFGLDLSLALSFVSFACATFALVILGEAVFRTRQRRRLAILLSATPLYLAALFGTAMLQTFLVAGMARRGWLPPGSILSSILRVPAGYAAILIASLWWARRLGPGRGERACLRNGEDLDRAPTQTGT